MHGVYSCRSLQSPSVIFFLLLIFSPLIELELFFEQLSSCCLRCLSFWSLLFAVYSLLFALYWFFFFLVWGRDGFVRLKKLYIFIFLLNFCEVLDCLAFEILFHFILFIKKVLFLLVYLILQSYYKVIKKMEITFISVFHLLFHVDSLALYFMSFELYYAYLRLLSLEERFTLI